MINKVYITQLVIYSAIFVILLIPFSLTVSKTISGGIILGFFAGILNAIKNNEN